MAIVFQSKSTSEEVRIRSRRRRRSVVLVSLCIGFQLTTFTTNHLVGTFSFTAFPYLGLNSTKVVTDGQFDVTY